MLMRLKGGYYVVDTRTLVKTTVFSFYRLLNRRQPVRCVCFKIYIIYHLPSIVVNLHTVMYLENLICLRNNLKE